MSEQITAEHVHLARWQDRLQDAIDQTLSPPDLMQVQTHLATCEICTQAHSRLSAVDAELRREFAGVAKPSTNFDQKVFAAIAVLEQDKRAAARQQEMHEYATRVAQFRNGWRELVRFHLGSIIGGVVTIGAVATAVTSAWPTMTKDLASAQQLAWLPHGWYAGLPAAVIASVAIAAAAIWITRRLDSRSG